MNPHSITELERMAKSFDIQPNGCWNWNKYKTYQGYGAVRVNLPKRTNLRAHRHLYTLVRGEIPKGLVIDHLCRNKGCVNPYHLEPVTCRENILRGNGPTAQKAKQSHCIRGHELDGDNLYVTQKGERRCRACVRARAKQYRENKHSNATKVINEVYGE